MNKIIIHTKSIENRNDIKSPTLYKFIHKNLNTHGCINLNMVSKEFDMSVKNIFDLLRLQKDILNK